MALRDLRVDMRAIVEARQRSDEDPVEPYLDMESGEVVWSIDQEVSGEPDEVQALLESDPERLVFIPRADGSEAWQRMSDFAAEVDEEDLRDALQVLDGKVIRQIIVRDSSQARALFKTIAREMTEIHGIAWRKRFIEGKSVYEVERYRLTVDENRVALEVAVTPALWRAFAGGGS